MSRRCRPVLLAALALTIACSFPRAAQAQACCAGGSVVTPARLELHEDALVGAQLRFDAVHGSYDPTGSYVPPPSGDAELDFEQDLFGALRVLRRGQVALLVPLVQTWRHSTLDGGAFGGWFGDVNASVRYDFVVAGQSVYVPGIALLAGVTAPTGRPPESAQPPLLVDASGIGAWQANVALALEQTYGPWLVNATGIVAKRTARSGQTLGTQWTLIAAGSYAFDNGAALALAASYAFEGSATRYDGQDVPASSKRLTRITLSGLWPLSDPWRVLGGLFLDPPLGGLGSNQTAAAGLTFTVIRSWS